MHVIQDTTVISMLRPGAERHQDVVFDGDEIVAVAATGAELPADATRIDGRDRFVMPGLIDAHAHFRIGDARVNRALTDLYLAAGSTSVLCLKGSQDIYDLRRAIDEGDHDGPRIFTSGPIHDEADLTYAEGRRAAAAEAAAGCEFIKVYNDLSVEGYQGLLDGAHEAGIRVLGHVPRKPGLDGVLTSGQMAIVHAEELLYTGLGYTVGGQRDWRTAGVDQSALRSLAQRVADAGLVVGPTLHCFFTIWQQSQDIEMAARASQLDCYPAHEFRRGIAPANEFLPRFAPPHCWRNLLEGYWLQVRLIEELHAAGVPLTAGTDVLVWNVVPDFIHSEIAELALCGLGNHDALRTATVNAAQMIEPGTKLGTIQAGAPADLLLLGADPTVDLRNTRSIEGVVARGHHHTRADLDARLDALREARAHDELLAAA